jgi:hypothetical protein
VNGRTAIEGLSANSGSGTSFDGNPASSCQSALSVALPTKRKPLRAIVRINRCRPAVSPIVCRATLILLVNVDSDTMRPFQTCSIRSSLLTTRS